MAYDIRWACDVLRPIYDRTDGKDGRVSIEVDPRIAHDSTRTTAEAKGLHWLVDRPNVLIKIPATLRRAGLHRGGHCRRRQRQRHADLRPRPLRRRHGRLPHRPRAGQGGRHRPVDDPLGRVVLRLAGRHRDRQAPRQDRQRRGEGAARQGRHRQRPAGLRSATRRCSPPTGGQLSRPPARTSSARCGPRPASRTRRTTTRCTSSSSSAPNTVNTMPEATLDAVADHGKIRGDTIHGTYDESAR